jgi:hypothetical protein
MDLRLGFRGRRPEYRSVCRLVDRFPPGFWANRLTSAAMVALILLLLNLVASLFKSKSRLEAENAALRHQLIVLRRKVRGPVHFRNNDRLFFVQLYRWFPAVLGAVSLIRAETIVRWHRAGFRRYWRWKTRSAGGRPQIDASLRALIRRMSAENVLLGCAAHPWRAAQARLCGSSVDYMVRKSDPSGQSWGTFLGNHAPHIAAMDLFVVPTIGLDLLYVLVIVQLARRELVWINVTAHPTAERIARKLLKARHGRRLT